MTVVRKSASAAQEIGRPDAPFFPEGATIRRVHREAIVLLGGGRALLMQVAHPAVAAGVAEHSSFRDGKRKRLLRTLKPTLAIVFGSDAQAREAAAAVNAVHSHVVGPGYRAGDPDLLFWVLATLIDTALFMHERFLGPLSEADTDAYYQEMLRAGELLGVRRLQAPRDIASFHAYMAEMMPRLQVTSEARSIAADLFSGRGLASVGGWFLRQMTLALLPADLRLAYEMPWSRRQEAIATTVIRATSLVLPRVPLALRQTPGFLLPVRETP